MRRLVPFPVYILIILAFFFGALELFARHLRPQLIHPSNEREKFCEYDGEIGWVNKPGVSGRFSGADFDVEIKINSRGLRGEEAAYEKPEGKKRIAVLGDSFTWGYGVEQAQTFSAKLQELRPGTEVLNFGCSGYGQDQELLVLRRKALRYLPDLVVVSVHAASDFENNASFFQYGYYKPFFRVGYGGQLVLENVPVPRNTPGAKLTGWLTERSVAFRLFMSRMSGELSLGARVTAWLDGKSGLSHMADKSLNAQELTCALCRDIQAEAARHESRAVFMLAPNLRILDGGKKNALAPEDKRYEELKTCLQKNKIDFFDLRPVFEARLKDKPETPLTFATDAHWNAEGHALAASALNDFLGSREKAGE